MPRGKISHFSYHRLPAANLSLSLSAQTAAKLKSYISLALSQKERQGKCKKVNSPKETKLNSGLGIPLFAKPFCIAALCS